MLNIVTNISNEHQILDKTLILIFRLQFNHKKYLKDG